MFNLKKILNLKLVLAVIVSTCLIFGLYFYGNFTNSVGVNALSKDVLTIGYSDYLKKIEDIKFISSKKYSEKVEKYKLDIEKELKIKLRDDQHILNTTKNINDVEQYFDYDETLWSEVDDTVKLTVKENRVLNYPGGQKGNEILPYRIEFNTKIKKITSFQENDIAGRAVDKNQVKISETEKDELARKFLAGFNKTKSISELPYAATLPKKQEELKVFFENKTKTMNNQQMTIASRAEKGFLDSTPLGGINAYAATTYAKYSAASYARYWGGGGTNWNPLYPKFGQDCTNFVSQAVLEGGLIKDYSNNDTYSKDWYLDTYNSKSQTWSVATRNADHMYDHENTGLWNRIYPSNAAYILDYGDLIYMNDSSGTHHVMMVTGAYMTSPDGKYHALYSQHTDDKSNADFDTGFNNSPNDVFWGLNIYGNVWDHI